ncbi:MAG TPA: hypothetical protein VF285_11330 [Castellaniella sp.]|uniref:hypothetical protein n=1 Tax=Castellaniella sp. TaxID=1955812 RepID=UPI002EFC8E4F
MTSIHTPKRVFDVDLFESAAKAAGITLEWWDDGESLNPGYIVNREGDWVSWDPLTNDGDALRLAVKLEINILPTMEEASARNPSHTGWINEDAARDPYAATRLAITRAAAEIGRRMES